MTYVLAYFIYHKLATSTAPEAVHNVGQDEVYRPAQLSEHAAAQLSEQWPVDARAHASVQEEHPLDEHPEEQLLEQDDEYPVLHEKQNDVSPTLPSQSSLPISLSIDIATSSYILNSYFFIVLNLGTFIFNKIQG